MHGLSQAIQKCGLPRAVMSDNGSAMVADEFTEGLLRLGILHETTLPYSAYQNGKQESFWAHLEGRLMEMLGKVPELTLDFLNQATQAWVEIEYNRRVHREIGCSPATRFAGAAGRAAAQPFVGRVAGGVSPGSEAASAPKRRHDLVGRRAFRNPSPLSSLPGRGGALSALGSQSGRSGGPREGTVLARLFPLDRTANADGRRAVIDSRPEEVSASEPSRPPAELPPLLRQILAEYSATGLPPAYLPKNPSTEAARKEVPHECQETARPVGSEMESLHARTSRRRAVGDAPHRTASPGVSSNWSRREASP